MEIQAELIPKYNVININRRKLEKLEPHLDRLNKICGYVYNKWSNKSLIPYTPHDYTHSILVEHILYELFPPDILNKTLSSEEIFLLLASVWLHDIGMIPPDDGKTGEPLLKRNKEIRDRHEELSGEYILEHKVDLGLIGNETDVLIKICENHRFKRYRELRALESTIVEGEDVNPQRLTACLRLADAFSVTDRTAVKLNDFKIYMAFGLDEIAKIHWLKSVYVSNIIPDKNMFKISIKLKKPVHTKYPGNWTEKMKPLEDLLHNELQDEVDAVRDILIESQLPIYLNVECESKDSKDLGDDEVEVLDELLTDIKLFNPTETPNDSAVTATVMRQIRYIFGHLFSVDKKSLNIKNKRSIINTFSKNGFNLNDFIIHDVDDTVWDIITDNKKYILTRTKNKYHIYKDVRKEESINNLENYNKNVLTIISDERSCHVFLRNIKRLLDRNIKANISYDEVFRNIQKKVEEWVDIKEKANNQIPKKAFEILKNANSIVLYGYSSSVLDCVKYFINHRKNKAKNFEVYVCHGATKNEHRFNNRLVYSDGIKYIEELKNIGGIDIHYIADSCASNLFSKKKMESMVLFGANGIDETGISHTLGHLAIADMARQYQVPVYVVADSLKIGKYNRSTGNRKNKWLTTDIMFETKFEGAINYNPREDIVPLDRIKSIITEKDVISPGDIMTTKDIMKYAGY